MNAPILEVSHLAKAFGSVIAVNDVSFTVAPRELVALIGPNGAGKSTCFNLINGQLRPDRGAISFEGRRIDGFAPRVIARLGVGRTFQIASTFASMTAWENVAFAVAAARREDGALRPYALFRWRDEAQELLERIGASALADAHCAALAYGDVKRVELAMALAASPKLLLMDEPTAGMTIAERRRLMQLIAPLARERAVAVLFTEHDMDVVFAWADRVLVLDDGALIAHGTPDEIRRDARVRAAYLGESAR